MTLQITTINSPVVLTFTVNCYLIRVGDDFFLIDTGGANKRQTIENEIERAGCRPGNLKLILLTHGDFDHCANAAYFHKKFGAAIAMHQDDSGMAEFGNMFWNRKKPNFLVAGLMSVFIKLPEVDRFKPDIYLEDGKDLLEYGFPAKVLNIPGHSKGSLGFLTAEGDLFCGDLLANTSKPDLWSIIDDQAAAQTSVDRLKSCDIGNVYPGHGDRFPMSQFFDNYSATG